MVLGLLLLQEERWSNVYSMVWYYGIVVLSELSTRRLPFCPSRDFFLLPFLGDTGQAVVCYASLSEKTITK